MVFQYSPYAIPLFLAAAMSIALALYALRLRQVEARVFGMMTAALSWWSLLYAISLSGADLETKYVFNQLKYVGVMAVPPLWLILALQYTQRRSVLTRCNIVLLFVPALILLPIVLTDQWTHLWWPENWLDQFGGRPVLAHSHGLAYYLHLGATYLYIVWGLGLYVHFYLRSQRIYRSQIVLMVIGATVPLAASVLTQAGFSPLPWGLDSFFFTLSSVLMALAIFRYRFLDIVPVARRTVVEQIPQGVIVIDARGRVVDANPAACALVQADGEAIVGRSLPEAVRSPVLREVLLQITQGEEDSPREHEVQLGAGQDKRVLLLSTTLLYSDAGIPIGQIVLVQDISERVAAREKLEALYRQTELERERLSMTIRSANDVIVLLDGDGKVLASNPSAQSVLRIGPDGLSPPALRAVLEQARARADFAHAEVEIDGQTFHATASPIPGTGLVLTMHDVTHFRQLAHLKDEFVATVSHDLRTPLAAILGYAELAQLEETSEPTRQHVLKRIEVSARRMTTLINDLLDLATLEAGMSLNLSIVQLGELASAAIEDLEGAALSKGVSLEYQLDVQSPVEADARLLMQVWRNLIDNAIKYTDRGTVTVRVDVEGERVIGQVADTGIGIPSADLPYVFDKFFRGKRPTTDKTIGTGLGLSLVRSIVEKHGGQIRVESVPGEGSTFTLTLPLYVEEVP